MKITQEKIEAVAEILTPEQIGYMKQVRAHSYPLNSPLLDQLERRNLLWQEGHQDSVMVTHFGGAVLDFLAKKS